MPTTTTDSPTRSGSTSEERTDRLDEAYRSLQASEAVSEEAVTSMIHSLSEFVRALLPGVVTEPARALDLTFELVQRAVDLQRRIVREVVGSVQVAMADMAADQPYGERSLNGAEHRGPGRSSARSAA